MDILDVYDHARVSVSASFVSLLVCGVCLVLCICGSVCVSVLGLYVCMCGLRVG